MSTKPAQLNTEGPGSPGSSGLFPLGRESTSAMLGMQRELLEACEQASRVWLSRVQPEANLWSKLASELMSVNAAPRELSDCRNEIVRRMQMTAEDGRRH